jgi:hypothetical protein
MLPSRISRLGLSIVLLCVVCHTLFYSGDNIKHFLGMGASLHITGTEELLQVVTSTDGSTHPGLMLVPIDVVHR